MHLEIPGVEMQTIPIMAEMLSGAAALEAF
jgi:hypothetical protein